MSLQFHSLVHSINHNHLDFLYHKNKTHKSRYKKLKYYKFHQYQLLHYNLRYHNYKIHKMRYKLRMILLVIDLCLGMTLLNYLIGNNHYYYS